MPCRGSSKRSLADALEKDKINNMLNKIKKCRTNPNGKILFEFSDTSYKTFPIEIIVNKLISNQKNDPSFNISGKKAEKFIEKFDAHTKRLDKLINKKQIIKIRNYLIKNSDILNKSNFFPSYVELYPERIKQNAEKTEIVHSNKPLLNNYAYDASFLWVALIKYPELQSKLMSYFIKKSPNKENFDQLFKLNLAGIIPEFLEKLKNKPKFKKEIEYLIYEFNIIRYKDFDVEKTKETILNKFNLKESFFFKNARLNRTPDYVTLLCQDINNNGEQFILKIMHRSYENIENRFKNEIEISKFFTKNKKEICPKYIFSNIKSKPEWFLYKYTKGEISGNYYRIYKHFLNRNILDKAFSNILEIQKNSKNFQKLLRNRADFNLKEKFDYMKYKSSQVLLRQKLASQKDIEKNLDFFIKNIKKADLAVAHNDLHPENVIINNNFVYFIDFNLAQLNTFFFDFSTFFLCGWEDKQWVKKSIELLANNFPELKNRKSSTRLTFDLSLLEASLKLSVHAEFPDTKHAKNFSEESEYAASARSYFAEVFKNLGDMFL